MSKHTAGPWYVVGQDIYRRPKEELYQFGGGTAGDKPLARVFEGWYGEDLQGYPVEANAHLIASAPELLEAAQSLMGLLDTPLARRRYGEGGFYLAAIELGRAAIAKAKGE